MKTIMTPVLMIGLASAAAMAQSDRPPAPKQRESSPPAAREATRPAQTKRISPVAVLGACVPGAEYDDVALRDVLKEMSDAAGVNIVVRWNKLAIVGVEPTTPITLSLKNVRFAQLLKRVLEEAAGAEGDLAYQAADDMILISSAQDINSKMIVRVYDVRDLYALDDVNPSIETGEDHAYVESQQPSVAPGAAAQAPVTNRIRVGASLRFGPGGNDDEDRGQPQPLPYKSIEQLIEVITTSIEPQTWAVNGGKGTIRAYNGMLVIRNSAYVHQQLAGAVSDKHKR
jgi:hypothetical protein